MKWMTASAAAFLVLSSCALAQPDERIPPDVMWKVMTNPVLAVVIADNVPLYYDDPQKGRRIRDTLRKGESVTVWWNGEPLDSPQHVYSPRNYFGLVDGKYLKFGLTEKQLWVFLMKRLEPQRSSPSASDADSPPFTVTSVIRGCKYFVAETPQGYSLVDEYQCLRPSRGDTGYGNLNTYSSVTVKLSGSSCMAWVDNYMMSKSSSLERQAEKCN